MSKPQSAFLNPPIDGLNLISDPASFKPTQARQLDNYYIYDWGIRERPAATIVSDRPASLVPAQMYSVTSQALNKRYTLIGGRGGVPKTYTYDGTEFQLVASYGFVGACSFNKKVILPQGLGSYVNTLDLTNWAYTVGAFTMSHSACVGAWAYRDRLYFINYQSSIVDYGGVGAVSGSVASFDFGQIFKRGQRVAFGCSWSYNQGVQNQDLFVVGNESGEILIYSGDWPAAANWQLVTRLDIPAPLTDPMSHYFSNVIKYGQDVLINTCRGIISLATVMAGKNDQTGYFSMSRAIGNVLGGALGDISLQVPFAYFASKRDLYVLNYERGAWSKFPNIAPSYDTIQSISCQTPAVYQDYASEISSYVLISLEGGNIIRINETALTSDTAATYTWATPYNHFGDPTIVKRATRARLLSRDMASSQVSHSLSMRGDFNDSTVLGMDARSKATTTTDYVVQEYTPTANARWLSYVFSKTGTGTSLNEIAGIDCTIETGGGY